MKISAINILDYEETVQKQQNDYIISFSKSQKHQKIYKQSIKHKNQCIKCLKWIKMLKMH